MFKCSVVPKKDLTSFLITTVDSRPESDSEGVKGVELNPPCGQIVTPPWRQPDPVPAAVLEESGLKGQWWWRASTISVKLSKSTHNLYYL
jgi:hypothetical protein